MALIAEGLPTLPGYVFRLNSLLNATPVDLNGVAEVIRMDPSLSAQVIRLCNSSLSDLESRIACIEDAVVMLGTDRLRSLVFTCSLVEYVDHQFASDAIQPFWQHSFLTALLTERIARWVGYSKPEQAYMAGLLHDIGLLPLLALAARERKPFPAQNPSAWGESVERERKDFGTDHCAIGRWIGIHWNFPAELIDVFEHHHHPVRALHDPVLVGMVAAADRFGQKHGVKEVRGPQYIDEDGLVHQGSVLSDCLPGLSLEEKSRLAELLETDQLHLTQMMDVRSLWSTDGPRRATRG
ncbi:MAG TPA: HDOD domain-containing protein [Terriglobia bacterium]|jgi:HD-like signal output (HDOD) protein|nr:HDOD domain-containing protein [Terriglobia bacterium]